MNVSLILPGSLRRTLLYTGVGLVFALGCSNTVPVHTDIAVDMPSCVDGALSMTFDVVSTQGILIASYQGGSGQVVGIPTIIPGTNSFSVIADLDTVALGDVVSMNFVASAFMNATIGAQNIQFYTVPSAQLPQPSACPPAQGPLIGTGDLPGIGFHLQVSNPTAEPMTLERLELAETPALLPNSALGWGNPDLESLPWHSPLAPGMPLIPGTPPIVIDLPDSPSPSTHGTLLRYVATFHGDKYRAIIQADLVGGTVSTQQTTWGAVKALYRGN